MNNLTEEAIAIIQSCELLSSKNKYLFDLNLDYFLKNNQFAYDIIKKDNIPINSVHHDYIDFIPDGLTVSAYSEDGIIEAVEDKKHKFFIGLEWHPEYLMDEDSVRIFDAFINEESLSSRVGS